MSSHPPNGFNIFDYFISSSLIFVPKSFLSFIFLSSKLRICSSACPKQIHVSPPPSVDLSLALHFSADETTHLFFKLRDLSTTLCSPFYLNLNFWVNTNTKGSTQEMSHSCWVFRFCGLVWFSFCSVLSSSLFLPEIRHSTFLTWTEAMAETPYE